MRDTPHLRLVSTRLLPLLPMLAALSSCAVLGQSISKPPTMEERAWQQETVLVEPGQGSLGEPFVFVDGGGRPLVAVPDRAFHLATKSIALARRGDAGWRVEVPEAKAPLRVCGRAEGEQVVLTRRELEGEPTALTWDGVTASPGATPDACPRIEEPRVRELVGSVPHRLELSKDGRTLWHDLPDGGTPCPPHDSTPGTTIGVFAAGLDAGGRPNVALYEQPEGEGPGHLRHAICDSGEWTSSMIAEGVRVIEVGMAFAGERPHIAYVTQGSDAVQLVHATPAEGAPAPAPQVDARVAPALEACARVWEQPPTGKGVEAFQSGDGLRCAVLERDATTGAQALEALVSRCDGGEARACALAGSLHHWLMGDVSIVLEIPSGKSNLFHTEWRGLRVSGVPEDTTKAAARFGQACEAGDVRACLYEAVLLPSGDARKQRARKACEGGLAAGCALAVVTTGNRPDAKLAERAVATLQAACDEGDSAACNDLGVLRHLRGNAAGAREAIDRACEAGLERACENRERLQGT